MSAASNPEFAAYIRKLHKIIGKHKASPATIVGTVLDAWCAQEYPWLTQGELPIRRRLLAETHVKEFLEALIKLPFLDAAYWLSSAYALLKGESYRKSFAMFFTPPPITERLLNDLEMNGVQFDKGSFSDPACGGAAFLVPIALRMRAALKALGISPRKILSHVEAKLSGMDLDSNLCALSRQFLKMALSDEIKVARRDPTFRVTTGNSLLDLEAHFGSIDVLVCNPPYRKTIAEEVDRCRHNFGDVIEAQPNMYGLFIALSIMLLKQDGVCAIVSPTSFLSGKYFSKLRRFLMKKSQVLSIGMVSDRSGVFIDVLQETALTLLRRTTSSRPRNIEASVSIVSGDGKYVDVGICVLTNSGAAWPIPRSESDVLLLKRAAVAKFRIKDYGYAVRIGAFVWNRDIRPVYMSAAEVKRRKAKTAVPLLWSSDVMSGGILKFDGTVKMNGEPRFVDFGDKHHRSIVRRASVILQRVTSNDQPRRLVAAVVPQEFLDGYGGFIGENHTVILEQIVDKPALTPSQMTMLLGSQVIDRYFRCISGATNVSSFELSQLSLPDPELLKYFLASGRSVEDATRMAVYGHSEMFVNPGRELRTST